MNVVNPIEPDSPFPVPSQEDDERIPVPPGDVEPEPIELPPSEEPKNPIDEKPLEPKIYL